jgi:hypothetical protein
MDNQFKNNIKNIQKLIQQKEKNTPFYGTVQEASSIITDYDHFPYTRWYRGRPNSYKPVVAEREAGFRNIENDCYFPKKHIEIVRPQYCFQPPCSTVFPCYTNENINENDTYFGDTCIVKNY